MRNGAAQNILPPRWLAGVSTAMLVLALIARILAPSDLRMHTQHVTIAYTSDIVAHGDWILPESENGIPATKPLLYNWLAAPFVAVAGYASVAAHKMPSLLAMLATWLLVVRLGNSLAPSSCLGLGWLAGIIFISNHMMFKLSWLARPDMLLALWCMVGWLSATRIILSEDSDGRSLATDRILFWSAAGLAALTKGPLVLLLLLYAILGSRLLGGSWLRIRRFHWMVGLPLSQLGIAIWLAVVWHLDPAHLVERLWGGEIWDRISGSGPAGGSAGPMRILTSAPWMPFYFLTRFAPWSMAAIGGLLLLLRPGSTRTRRWQEEGNTGRWLMAACVFACLSLLFFSISAGKRADYLAPVLGPSALVAAFWCWKRIGAAASTGLAMLLLVGLATFEWKTQAPFGDAVVRFSSRVNRHLDSDPACDLRFFRQHSEELWGLLGARAEQGTWGEEGWVAGLSDGVMMGEDFWLVAGWGDSVIKPWDPVTWMKELGGESLDVHCRLLVRSDRYPTEPGWAEDLSLYRVTFGTGNE